MTPTCRAPNSKGIGDGRIQVRALSRVGGADRDHPAQAERFALISRRFCQNSNQQPWQLDPRSATARLILAFSVRLNYLGFVGITPVWNATFTLVMVPWLSSSWSRLHPRVDFLGIGAQKAGTSWLWTVLHAEPRIWMAPKKELHYFDRALRYPSTSILATDRFLDRLLSRARHNRQFRDRCRTDVRNAISRRDWKLLRWFLRYYCGTCDDAWYLSLFHQGSGRVCGEITPAYAILDREDVARIHRLLPSLKIIFLLRNPIDRAWSRIRFGWTQGELAALDDFAQIRAVIDRPGSKLRGDYLRTLDIWESYFPHEQVFIGFFDDIVEQPAKLLRDVLSFLGLDPGSAPEARLRRNVGKSRESEMPLPVRRYLTEKYLPDLEKLSARFGGHAERWRADARQ